MVNANGKAEWLSIGWKIAIVMMNVWCILILGGIRYNIGSDASQTKSINALAKQFERHLGVHEGKERRAETRMINVERIGPQSRR